LFSWIFPYLVAILWLSEESATASLFNLLIVSVAYTVSSVINICNPPENAPLYLYHVIQASYLIWLANLTQLIGFGVYSRKIYRRKHALNADMPKARTEEQFGEMMIGRLSGIQITASWCLSVCMWIRASTLGADSQELRDSTQVYIIYSYHLQATSKGRVVALISLSIIMALYLAFIAHTVAKNMTWIPMIQRHQHAAVDAETQAATRLAQKHQLPEEHIPTLRRANSVPITRFRAFEVAFFIVYVPVFVGFVVAIELQRSRNNLCSDSSTWGFGQVSCSLDFPLIYFADCLT
jgi:hypothetical protein